MIISINGLFVTHFEILSSLTQPKNISEVCRYLGYSYAYTFHKINDLIKKGLIQKLESNNKRQTLVKLTKKGNSVMEAYVNLKIKSR